MSYMDRYKSWLDSEYVDDNTKEELLAIQNDSNEIEDRFYKDLEFGTAGLRGIIGAGSNRMNIYSVGLTTQGLANYITKWGQKGRDGGVVIAYDSRIMSKEFAEYAAGVLCANGIKAYLFNTITPVPILSFAIKKMGCISGIMITASHNPSQYNGYKVYWKEGYQLIPSMADEISEEINKISTFKQINIMAKETAMDKGLYSPVDSSIYEDFTEVIISQCLNKDLIRDHHDALSIVYSPLHGSGYNPIKKALSSAGFSRVHIVEEQAKPDGDFPTVEVPNPEDPNVFKMAKSLALKNNGEIIIATDPDADRVGIAYRNDHGAYVNLTGNQIGCIIEYYILTQLKQRSLLPENGVIIKSIVTTELAQIIADDFNIKLENTLTGFKYIGEKIEEYQNTKIKKFIMGFEESYGYLIGDHARDKDAVGTSLVLCEMALYYKLQNKSLGEVLKEIYEAYGYYLEDIQSITLEGKEGRIKLQRVSDFFRRNLPMKWAGKRVTFIEDYLLSKKTIVGEGTTSIVLPTSNVLKVYLEGNSWFCIRPSGTEPKIKIYFSIKSSSEQEAKEFLSILKSEVMEKAIEAQNSTT
ncbi:MAG: phospho-sugar mutase [Eubacteriales bacterium]